MTDRAHRKNILALGVLALAALPALLPAAKAPKGISPQARFEAGLPPDAPKKLSDLYKFFTKTVQEGLGAEVQSSSVRVTGRSWELIRDGKFPEVEISLKPFEAQGIKFDKGEFLFRRMEVDSPALIQWKLKLKEVREVESRLVFTLRSLAKRLSDAAGAEIKLQTDTEEQLILLSGPGAFCAIPCAVEARCQLVWDENAKTLRLKTLGQSFGGHEIPGWLWWLGRSPVPQAPILDFGFSWIPFNIQEVHAGWDQVNLSTNW